MTKYKMEKEMKKMLTDYANMNDNEFYEKHISWRTEEEIRIFIEEFPKYLGEIDFQKEDYK